MARRDDAAIRESVRAIVAAVIAPNAERVDREGTFPRENFEALARGRADE
ncbi:acyl-CoA dehydrogenase family protein [Sorangium sp. So ce1153]